MRFWKGALDNRVPVHNQSVSRGKTMDDKRTKIAIIGAGEVANKTHLPIWARMRDVEVVAICDADEDTARTTSCRWGVSRYYADLAELLNQENLDLVDICTPPATRAVFVSQALEAGCHVLIEKPMGMTLEESQKIVELYNERTDKHLKLSVVYNWLFHPLVLDIFEKIKKGFLGDVLSVEIRFCQPPTDPMISNPDHWCHTLPGGRFGEVLIHPTYVLYRFLGNLEVEGLQVANRGLRPWVPYGELFVTLKGENGFGTIYISFNSPRPDFPVITVYGTKAQLYFRAYNLSLLTLPARATKQVLDRGIDALSQVYQLSSSLTSNMINTIAHRRKTSHEIFIRYFLNSLEGTGDVPVTVEEAYSANRIFLSLLSKLPSWNMKSE